VVPQAPQLNSFMRSVSFDYSVVIPAYNEEEYLPSTLRSLDKVLRKIPQFRGEVIVVNNGSTDRTAQIAEQYGAKVVEETNRGIGRARNRGAAMAKGETLIFLDADTWLCLPTLKTALEQISNGICGGGGALVKFDQHYGRFLSGMAMPALWNFVSKTCKLAAGSFIFCRKKDFVEVGGFSEKLYAGEEIHFCLALKKILRKQKLPFLIIEKHPVITSSRKLLWYKDHKIVLVLLTLLLFPFTVRYRKLCGFWYSRPPSK